jgi:hypothetical protein
MSMKKYAYRFVVRRINSLFRSRRDRDPFSAQLAVILIGRFILNDVSATILGVTRIFGYNIRDDSPISLPSACVQLPDSSQWGVC